MRYFSILILFIVHFSHSQNSSSDRADSLASAKNYSDEIMLRKSILDTISNKNSEAYKTHSYKLNLAEFHNAADPGDRLEYISKAEDIFSTLKAQDPFVKIEIGMHHFESYSAAMDSRGKEKIIEVYEFASQQPPSPELDEWLSYIYYSKGRTHLYYKELDQAVYSLEEALEKNKELYGYNSLETAEVFNELAIAHSYTNDYPKVLSNADKALEIYETIQPKDPFILFNQYAENFQGHKYYGDFSKVEELYEKIQDYYEANKHKDSFINYTHSDYKNLKPVSTIYYYVQLQYATINRDPVVGERAFSNFKETMPKNRVSYTKYELNRVLAYYLETGSLFHKLDKAEGFENYYKARKYYTGATKFTKKYGYDFGELQSYMMLGILGVDYEKWEDVITYSNKALNHPNIKIFNQTQTIKHNLGLAYGEMKEFDKAFEIFDEEYAFYLEDAGVDYYAISNLIDSGNLYLELYEEEPKKEHIEKAFNNFELASTIFSKLYRGGEFSSRLQVFSNEINNGLLLSAIQLGENQKAAIERVEINNSDYLWSSFLKNRKEPLSDTALALEVQIDSLRKEQSQLASEIASDTLEEQDLVALRKELKSTEKKYNSAQKALKEQDNSFYQFSRTDFNLSKIQNKIRPNERIIKYIKTEASVFAYVMGPKHVNLFKLEITGNALHDKLTSYLATLKDSKLDFRSKAKSLYSDLIEPLSLEKNTALIIVPDQSLAYLPFETLIDEENQSVIDNHAVSYGYSLKLMDIQNTLKGSYNGQLAAFSPNYDLDFAQSSDSEDIDILVRSGNYELAGAKKESEQISSIFKGDLFLGNDATKLSFLDNSLNYDILHLAMHAVIDEENPALSNLIFENDERLYLDELYQLKIPAHLAVLSACNTGFGELKDGEGVQSLSRAFTYAGVKSTVMSLWPVPDKQTSEIMTEFYKHLKAGESKSEALRLAKLNYLENVKEPELKHPYYWAGFLINGDVDPLQTSTSIWYYIGFGILLLIVILLLIQNRRKSVASS